MIEALTRTGILAQELAELALRVQASVVAIRSDGPGFGSGVAWNDAGLIVTNHHVAPRSRASVRLGHRDWRPAHVVARSERHDLAALQVAGDLPDSVMPAQIGDARALRPGQLVIAVGNPVGERNAVTLGIVSGAPAGAISADERDVIRTAITLRPGNSGGALADVYGQVVGIPNMVVGPGLGIAVPSHVVRRMLDRASRPTPEPLGILGRWVELSPPPASAMVAPRLGLLVLEVAAGSRAERAGVTMGDVIVSPRDGRAGATELIALVEAASGGEGGVLTVIRAGTLLRLDLAPVAA
jgi:S1-C subfamily serine protease